MTESIKSYYRYWGKVDKDGNNYHLLPYHCLDVAAVGWILLSPQKSLCIRVSEQLKIEPTWLRDFFVFCLTLHDLGKFSRAFQGLKPNLSPDLVKSNPRMRYSERHDSLGFWLWKDNFCKQVETSDPNNSSWLSKIEPWMEIVTDHHGIPPKKSGGMVANSFEQEDEEAACRFIQDVCDIFLAKFDHAMLSDKDLKKRLKTVSWQLAGIAVLADWTGSNNEHFDYYSNSSKSMALMDYWEKIALPSAEKAVRSMPEHPKVRKFQNIYHLFPFINQPTPLQEYAINEPLVDGPQLFILEDVTGAGKTEAAIVLTHRLLSSGLAEGLYVALPTMATANAMYQRLGGVYRRFYDKESTPSLILAHGARDLSEAFRESVFLPENSPEEIKYADTYDGEEELSASAYCNAWLSDSRKKALLADVGIGTLDQALLAVLPARHQSLRLLGLENKVLLVDEVHAYDSYMQKLLDALLEAHARQGGSVILLSATLPKKMRQELIAAFHRGIDSNTPEIGSNAYPLASHAPAVIRGWEKSIDTRKEVKRTVTVIRMDTEGAVIKQIQEAINKGKCVCWIRNTVKAARQSYNDLIRYDWIDRDHLHLFHSRFAMVDRQEIESDTLRRFGEKSNHEDRKGQVLIATQVVEQSLDLDFDVLITDLAPIDLIIQRAGRLCRHIRDAQGNRIRKPDANDQRDLPILYLFSPDPTEDTDENWLKTQQQGTQAVYPHIGQLWLTAKLLLKDGEGEGKFSMPGDARGLIEGVYSYEAGISIPEKLLNASMEADVKNMSQKSMADLNALKLNKGYTRSSGEWDEEIRIPTRLSEEESISVALASLRLGKLQPYATATHHAWAMSIVKIPEWEWKKANQQISTTMQKLIEDLKTEVKALRWFEIFPLTDGTKSYYNTVDGWQPETGESL
jgi:CRISPR-associated endonuclease/helicase Cas3